MTFTSLCSTCCVLTRSIVSIFHTVRVIIFLVPGSCIVKNPNVAFQGVCTFVLIFDICRETKLPRIYYQRELFFLNTYANTSLFFSFQTMVWGWGGVKNVSTSELHILMCSAKHEKEKSVRKSRSPQCYPPSAYLRTVRVRVQRHLWKLRQEEWQAGRVCSPIAYLPVSFYFYQFLHLLCLRETPPKPK